MKLKTIITILIVVLFTNIQAQSNLPVLKTDKSTLSYRIGKELYFNNWNISPKLNPDVLKVVISEATKVDFISEKDSLSFLVEPDSTYNFVVIKNDTVIANTQIRGIKEIQKATFSESYKRKHDKQIYVEIPEVYELVKIIFAITPTGREDNGIINKKIPYYNSVINHFDKFKNEKIISIIDSLISPRLIYHCELKLDAYSFEFNKLGEINKKKEYNITSREFSNTLLPYISLIEEFAEKTDFRKFYNENSKLYESQISYYKDSIDVKGMFEWLYKNFPNGECNSIKIVFSPLVSGWQNANTLINNNFTEVFAHVNFPSYSGNYSAQERKLKLGNAIFTELNHNYLNSQYKRSDFSKQISNALGDLNKWIDKSKSAKNYNNPKSCFDEYMNWGLVSLWYIDKAPKNLQEKLIKDVEDFMSDKRGFKKFNEFNKFLIDTYLNKEHNEVISDLYPQLIKWFQSTKLQN